MAVVTVSTGERFEGEAARQYLDEHGVVLEFWSADALPEDLRKERTPSSEQKDEILTALSQRHIEDDVALGFHNQQLHRDLGVGRLKQPFDPVALPQRQLGATGGDDHLVEGATGFEEFG